MKSGRSDSHMWSLWPIERLISENARYDRPHILFADFLIDSHFYCFSYVSEEQSAVSSSKRIPSIAIALFDDATFSLTLMLCVEQRRGFLVLPFEQA